MKIAGISAYNQNIYSNRNNISSRNQKPAFGKGFKAEGNLMIDLSKQAVEKGVTRLYEAKYNKLYNSASDGTVLSMMYAPNKNIIINFKNNKISKTYGSNLAEAESKDKLIDAWLGIDDNIIPKLEQSIKDHLETIRQGVVMKAIADDKMYSQIMNDYAPEGSRSIYAAVENMPEEQLIEYRFYKGKKPDLMNTKTRLWFKEQLNTLAEVDKRFSDPKVIKGWDEIDKYAVHQLKFSKK